MRKVIFYIAATIIFLVLLFPATIGGICNCTFKVMQIITEFVGYWVSRWEYWANRIPRGIFTNDPRERKWDHYID